MPRPINRLSARAVQTAGPGYHADGGGLYLLVSRAGTASWVFRYTLRARKREMGLGSASVFSLAEARQRAAAQRKLLADGIDPIETRTAARAVRRRTWGEALEDFLAARSPEWRSPGQAAQWRQSLADYGPPADLPLDALTTAAVVDLLRQIWTTKTETATRVQGRIARIWDAERVAGHVRGDNPARWRGHLDHLLPRPAKVRQAGHHTAMPFAEVPALMAALRARDSTTRQALRWTILTAARTGETLGATWDEIDLGQALWTIPGARMKAGREHVVPLCAEALAIAHARAGQGQRLFPLSGAAMLKLLRAPAPGGLGLTCTVHGFRSAFRDWVAETTDYPDTVAEMALAHTISDETIAAYRRGKLLEKRRALMTAWGQYLAQPPAAPM